jgi:hypothetical protein
MNVNDDERLPWLRDEKALICDVSVRVLARNSLRPVWEARFFRGKSPRSGCYRFS